MRFSDIPLDRPVATITDPLPGTTYAIGDVVSFSGSATDHEDGPDLAVGLHAAPSFRRVSRASTRCRSSRSSLRGTPRAMPINWVKK